MLNGYSILGLCALRHAAPIGLNGCSAFSLSPAALFAPLALQIAVPERDHRGAATVPVRGYVKFLETLADMLSLFNFTASVTSA